ncbi:MAG: type II/IV secretion system protein [Phycisphaeraceae bacterium]|nr:type II/IV secretion system protein [Phycisphaeraceae bacterium]
MSSPAAADCQAHGDGPGGGARSAPSGDFLALISRDFARLHLVLSEGVEDGCEILRATDSSDPAAVFNVGVRLGRAIRVRRDAPEAIARDVDAAYGLDGPVGGGQQDQPSSDTELGLELADRDLLSTSGKGDVVRTVDSMLFRALTLRASDVHVQPLEDRTLVRYRVDGAMFTDREIDRALTPLVVGRIKVMAKMDIAERRVPQDGRASVSIGSALPDERGGRRGPRVVDLRISTLPTSHGERVVIRLLDNDPSQRPTDFEGLGMPGAIRAAYLDRASRSSGIVLLTGPTGSGKTTTLYATLRWLSAHPVPDGGGACPLNIMTIEDPIEYELSGVGVSQAQVNARKGVTFAAGLRHILRQDPDVIMVGEIRDADTARIAIQASLTGHLVFSTLHTNDAPTAVTRLLDLGVEPFLLSTSLSAVMAQRLVRRVHADCRGHGCEACLHSGFLGRIALFEFLAVTEPLRERIAARGTASEIRRIALGNGMRPLRDAGGSLIRAGLTTEAEVRRVTLAAEEDCVEPARCAAVGAL